MPEQNSQPQNLSETGAHSQPTVPAATRSGFTLDFGPRLALSFISGILLIAAIISYIIYTRYHNNLADTEHIAETVAASIAVPIIHEIEEEGASQDGLNSPALQDLMADFYTHLQRHVVLVDPQKKIIASRIPEHVGRIFNQDSGQEVTHTLSDGQVRTFIEQDQDFPDGLHLLVIPLITHNNEIVGAVILDYQADYLKVVAENWKRIRTLLTLSLVVLGVTTLLGFAATRSILMSVHRFKEAAIRLGQGDLDTPIPIEYQDEIGRTFESMRLRLRSTIQQLEFEVVERKQAESALISERTLLRTIIDAIPDWIFIKDQNHRFLLVNQTFAASLHLPPEACLGKDELELGYPEDVVKGNPEKGIPGFWTSDRKVLDTGQINFIPEALSIVDGLRFIHNTVKLPLRDEAGQIWGVLGCAHDVTESKQAENALRESEARLRSIFDTVLDGIITIDERGIIETINIAVERLFGYQKDELVGQNIKMLMPSPDCEQHDGYLANYLNTGQQKIIGTGRDTLGRRKDGTVFPMHLAVNEMRLGDRLLFTGVVSDITRRIRAETELANERNLLRALTDNLPDHIYIKDRASRFLLVNPATARMLGKEAEETVVGKTDFDFSPPELAQQYYADEQALFESGQPLLNHEEPFADPQTGQTRWLLSTKVPFRDETGQIAGLIGLNRDITDRKQMEETLRQAKETAESATRIKSEFLATMSHEIRTPLNGVIGMTSLLLDTELTSQQADFTRIIRTSGEALLSVINDILDFSKIEAGKLELEEQPFDLWGCVENTLDLVAVRAADKELELAYHIDPQTPGVLLGDETRLRQILLNLLSNAIKFTDKGEVVVRVSGVRCQGSGGQEKANGESEPRDLYELHFAVQDTGVGIPADRLDRLFQSFSQVDTSTTRRYGGTGLGLAISKRLSELMGGTIRVESAGVRGQGSVFHFTIQAKAVAYQAQFYAHDAESHLHDKRVLIIDNDTTYWHILLAQLEGWGLIPVSTKSPLEALEWIRRGDPFDLVLLDMDIPEMDGLTLAGEIRHYRSVAVLPLVKFTLLEEWEVEPPSAEFAAYLSKPVKQSQLFNTLVDIFMGRPVKATVRTRTKQKIDTELARRLPLRILLAEDNATNQRLALQILQKMGYRADVAANGLEVLQALERQPYDLILMDMQMPEMDGLEATRLIRSDHSLPDRQPRIIALTANAMRGDRELCLEAGMDDYITKPIQIEELQASLERWGQPSAAVEPTVPSDSNEGPIDWAVLERLATLQEEGQPDFVQEVLDLYLSSSSGLIAEIQQAAEQGQAESLQHAAHTLKSSSQGLGVMQVGKICADLEAIGRNGSTEGTESLVADLAREFEIARQTLQERESVL